MDDKRIRYKAYYKKSNDAFKQWCEDGYNSQALPKEMPLPDDLKDLRCGAKTKATGSPCKIKAIYSNGRCKFHGGLSTGARTAAGKKKVALNGFKKGWRKQSP